MTVISASRGEGPAVVTVLLWSVGGIAWVAEAFLPWTSRGPLASSSSLDAARLLGGGALDDLVPRWAAAFLLVLPALGVLLLGLSGTVSRPGGVVRGVALLLGGVTSVLAVHLLTSDRIGLLGPGGWVSLAGTGLGAVALLSSRARSVPLHEGVSR